MMKPIDPIEIGIRQQTQTHPCSLREQVRQFCRASAPLLAWAEPQIRLRRNAIGLEPGRDSRFVPLTTDSAQDWPDDLPLVEARLFWDDRAVHLLAVGENSCKSVTLTEIGEQKFWKQELPLLTLRKLDIDRFGLAALDWKSHTDLVAIEYRQAGRLIAWRLTVNKAGKDQRNV